MVVVAEDGHADFTCWRLDGGLKVLRVVSRTVEQERASLD